MKFNFFGSSRLLKASYYNALLVLVKVLSGIISSKVVAVYLGPSGLALLGNLKSFLGTASSFTAEGYQNGIIRYVSENSEETSRKAKITTTVFQLSTLFSILIGLILWFFSITWSQYLFKTADYDFIIKIVAIGLPFWSFNLLIIYILNGLENYKKLVAVSSVLSIVNMLTSILLIIKFNLIGGLIAVILGPVIVFVVNIIVLGSERHILLNLFKFKLFKFYVVKDMSAYLLMAIYSTAIVSITVLLIRNLIIEKLSIDEAGYWEAMNRISTFYLMFFTSLTSFYLLPRLSKISDSRVFKSELKGFYSLSIPLLVVSFIIIYFLRFFILKLLLSDDFLPTSSLFFWQLVGDFISILAIALVKQFHAKRMVQAYLICNGILNILYYVISCYFIEIYGLIGVTKAYALSYLVYLIIVFIFVFSYFKRNNRLKHE
ncbi:O-antigen translocase [Seonamhaeicola sp. MEBiC1930]|uniref:O-antigen translocase n=1 Tax=Seonamhaeicola sp. MEBiC01930 TaxID=2976768 RepID=UPI003249C64D